MVVLQVNSSSQLGKLGIYSSQIAHGPPGHPWGPPGNDQGPQVTPGYSKIRKSENNEESA